MSRWCLIVATIGRQAEVDRLLASLAHASSDPPPRVVLVDQNQDGRLDGVVATWSSQLPLERIVMRPQGVSAARNAGLARIADEPFVAFPDDDCFFEPMTLTAVEAAFAARPDADVVIGTLHEPEQAASPSPALDAGALSQPTRIGLLRGSGMPLLFFRRSAVAAAGSFDLTLGPGGGTPWLCGEDADFLLAAVAAGKRAMRSRAARVFHPPVAAGGSPAKAHGYGRGRIRLLRKHGYPWWFVLLSVFHPLTGCVLARPAVRRFRWHLFRGRLREWLRPHRQVAG